MKKQRQGEWSNWDIKLCFVPGDVQEFTRTSSVCGREEKRCFPSSSSSFTLCWMDSTAGSTWPADYHEKRNFSLSNCRENKFIQPETNGRLRPTLAAVCLSEEKGCLSFVMFTHRDSKMWNLARHFLNLEAERSKKVLMWGMTPTKMRARI